MAADDEADGISVRNLLKLQDAMQESGPMPQASGRERQRD